MSVGSQIAEIYGTLQEIDGMLGKLDVRVTTLRTEAVHAAGQLREVEYIFYRITSIMGRMGLPPNIDQAISIVQRLVLAIRLLHTSMMMIEVASGPFGWAMAAVSLGSLAVSGGDLIYDATRGS